MKRFRYAADPLCAACCVLYALNRWGIQPHTASGFFRGQFNDLLLIPCALPYVLWLQRRLGWRKNDDPPDAAEIVFHLVVWSVLFEVIGPHIMRVTGDARDVVAYAAGALVAFGWWRRRCARTATP